MHLPKSISAVLMFSSVILQGAPPGLQERAGRTPAAWLDFALVAGKRGASAGKVGKADLPHLLLEEVRAVRRRLETLRGVKARAYILGRRIRVEVFGGGPGDRGQVASLLWAREPFELRIVLDRKTGDLDPEAEKARLAKWARDPKNLHRLAEDPFFIDRFNRLPSEKGGPKAAGRIRWAPFSGVRGYGLPSSALPFPQKKGKKGEFWAFLPLRMDIRGFTGKDLDPASLRIVPDLHGKTALSFAMKKEADRAFRKVTGENAGHVMAGLVRGVAVTAPIIQEALPGAGIFTKGNNGFDRKELESLLKILKTGPPPVRLRLKAQGAYREEGKEEEGPAPSRTRPPSAFRLEARTGLPGAIRVYKADLAGPVRCFAVYVPQDAGWDIRVVKSGTPAGKEPLTSLASKWKALVAVNGGYFSMKAWPCREEGLLVLGGKVVSPPIQEVRVGRKNVWVSRAAAGFFPRTRVEFQWVFLLEGKLWALPRPLSLPPRPPSRPGPGWRRWSPPFVLQAGPMLLRKGRPFIPRKEERLFASMDARHPRTALGTTGRKETVLLVVEGRQKASRGTSLAETAHILQRLGCKEAMNLDGGGSSTLVIRGRLWNLPQGKKVQRPVPNAVVVLPGKGKTGR